MNVDFDKIRHSEFPALKHAIQLKASGGSPMCRSAFEASERYLKEMCFEGDIYYDRYLAGVDNARRLTAQYLNAEPDEIGFQVNSSSAAQIAAALLGKKGVERVFFPIGEFPTSVHAIRNLGIEAFQVGSSSYRDSAETWLEEIDDLLKKENTPKKSALVASHVCFLNGTTIDLEGTSAFCRERDLTLVVNATQSFGALDIDVGDDIAMLFATGLKWAAAGYGAGFLYVRQSLVDAIGLCEGTGWLSVDRPYRMDHRNSKPIRAARSLDAGGGMPHFGPLLAFNGALTLYERIGDGDIKQGVSAVQRRALCLAARLREGLLQRGFDVIGDIDSPPRSGIVSIDSKNAKELFDVLSADNILTSLRSYPNTGEQRIVRFGVHYFNTEDEIETALETLERAV
jgi:cysteine desulfurase/selenocysteine lyase